MATFAEFTAKKKQQKKQNETTGRTFAEFTAQRKGLTSNEESADSALSSPATVAKKETVAPLPGGKKFSPADVVGKYQATHGDNATLSQDPRYKMRFTNVELEQKKRDAVDDALDELLGRQQTAQKEMEFFDSGEFKGPQYLAAERIYNQIQQQIAEENKKAMSQQQIDEAKAFQEMERWQSATGRKGFADASAYEKNDDLKYNVINRDPEAVAKSHEEAAKYNWDIAGVDMGHLEQMTDEEISLYNYYYSTVGKEKADEYLASIESDLKARRMGDRREWYREYAEQNPVAASAFSVLTSPVRGLSYVGQAADYLKGGKMDANEGYNIFTRAGSDIRGQVSSDIEKNVEGFWGKAGSFAYNTGMSMGDFLMAAGLSGGVGGIATTIMGTGAAAQTVLDAKDRGLNDDQAFALGTIAGVAETLTEKFSVEALLDRTAMGKGAVTYILKNAITEGSEEAASGIINTVADVLVSKDKSEWAQSVEDYKAQGMSEKEAFWRAVADQAKNIGLDALGGMLSGGLIGSVGAIGNTAVQQAAQPKKGAEIATDMGIGKRGAEAAEKAGITPENVGAFTANYEAGKDGKAFEEVKTAQTGIDENVARQAYNAGQMDAIAEGTAEQAKYFGKESKLVKDENFKKAHLSSKDTRKMDSLAKVLGVQIRYVDRVDVKDAAGNIIGEANAQYLKGETGGIIEISLNNNEPGNLGDPFMVSVVHEAIHRIRETSPDIYDGLARFVQENMSEAANARSLSALQNVYGTSDINALTEEQVADAFGRMMQDSEVLSRLAADNRNVLEKIRDFIKDIINAVNRALNNQNIRLSAEQQSEFADLRARFTEMETLFEDALKQSGQVAKRSGLTGGPSESGNAMFSLKDKKVPTYGELISKQDVAVVDISTPVTRGSYAERRWQIKEQANEVIKKPYLNRDTDTMIFLTKKTYDHAFSNKGEMQINAAEHLPELVESAVLTHAEPSDHGSQYAEGAYTFFGAVRYGKSVSPVKLKVMEYSVSGQDIPENIKAWFEQNPEIYAAAYDSVVLEVLEIEESPSGSVPSSQPKTDGSKYPQGLSDTIKVSDLIQLVNGDAKKYVPSSAVKGETRTADLNTDGTAEASSGTLRSLKSRDRIEKYVAEYGAIEPGENPFRTVQVPKKTSDTEKVSKTIRTIMEAGTTPDMLLPDLEELVADGAFSYESVTDKGSLEKAESRLNGRANWKDVHAEWSNETRRGAISKDHTVMGWALYNKAIQEGDTKTAIGIVQDMVGNQRNAAQALQATRVLKKMSPEAQLYSVQRSIDKMQEEINNRYRKKFKKGKGVELKVDEELYERFLNAKTDKERAAVYAEIYEDIGRQMPSDFRDKWNAWRYLAMLGNPRTHVRNILGNALFAPVVSTKNTLAKVLESAVSAASGGEMQRTKGFVNLASKEGRELYSAAWNDYDNVSGEIMAGGKYSDFEAANEAVEKGRTVFKHLKNVEGARRLNSKLLSAEDTWFSKPHYAAALSSYCKANGITPAMIEKGTSIDTARKYAIREAQKATYRDANALSNLLSRAKTKEKSAVGKAVNVVVEGILPFKKTPANILVRGLEYSPLGLLKSISYDLARVNAKDSSKRITAAEMIDNLSAGLTGTGLMALGFFLAKSALITLRGHGASDEKENEFEELMGHQAYSLEVGGKSYTLDWMAPEAIPLFIGANIYERTVVEGEKFTMSLMFEVMNQVSEPMLEMSCIQSVNDVLESIAYAKSSGKNPLVTILADAATNYITQIFPTSFGQIERVFQDRSYTAFTQKDEFLTSDQQYLLSSISAKIPGLDYQQIPYIDAWGRQELTGNVAQRAANNFLNPAYVSDINASGMEEELLRLYEATDAGGVFPTKAPKSFPLNGETKYLTADEYVKYATQKGQVSYELVSNLVNTQTYKNMSDEDKAKAISEAYSFANVVAKKSVSNYTIKGWEEKAIAARKSVGISYAKYLEARVSVMGIKSLKDEDGETIANSESLLKMEAIYQIPGLTDAQRAQLFEDFDIGKKVRGKNKAAVQEALEKMR